MEPRGEDDAEVESALNNEGDIDAVDPDLNAFPSEGSNSDAELEENDGAYAPPLDLAAAVDECIYDKNKEVQTVSLTTDYRITVRYVAQMITHCVGARQLQELLHARTRTTQKLDTTFTTNSDVIAMARALGKLRGADNAQEWKERDCGEGETQKGTSQ